MGVAVRLGLDNFCNKISENFSTQKAPGQAQTGQGDSTSNTSGNNESPPRMIAQIPDPDMVTQMLCTAFAQGPVS